MTSREYGASPPEDHADLFAVSPSAGSTLSISGEQDDIIITLSDPLIDPLAVRLLAIGRDQESQRLLRCKHRLIPNPSPEGTLDQFLERNGDTCNQRFCPKCRKKYNASQRKNMRNILFDHREQGDTFSYLTCKSTVPSLQADYSRFIARYQALRRLKAFEPFHGGIGAVETRRMPVEGDLRINLRAHIVLFSKGQNIDVDTLRARWVRGVDDSLDLRPMSRRNDDLKRVANYSLKSPWLASKNHPLEWPDMTDTQLIDHIDGVRGKRLVIRWGAK